MLAFTQEFTKWSGHVKYLLIINLQGGQKSKPLPNDQKSY